MASIKDNVRTLLRIRKRRQVPTPGPKPKYGTLIVCKDVQMEVDTDLDDDLWDWLVLMGWRQINVRLDRRRYRRAPEGACTALKQASLGERELLNRRILHRAH